MTMRATTKESTQAITLDQYGDLLSTQDISEILGISKQTTYREIKKGTFGNHGCSGEHTGFRSYILLKDL